MDLIHGGAPSHGSESQIHGSWPNLSAFPFFCAIFPHFLSPAAPKINIFGKMAMSRHGQFESRWAQDLLFERILQRILQRIYERILERILERTYHDGSRLSGPMSRVSRSLTRSWYHSDPGVKVWLDHQLSSRDNDI